MRKILRFCCFETQEEAAGCQKKNFFNQFKK
jgi:hypothetical protein